MTAPYTAGTIDLVSGSATVVGTDTAWEVSLIIGGTIYVEFDGGNPMPIATVDSDTEITAALKWTGPTGTYSYAIMRDTAYGQQTVANAQALATYIQRLNNPALAAAAGVTPSADKMLLFTGPNSATVIDLADVLGGDFNGPEGGVAENDFVVFADDTGKLGKKAPPNSIPNSLLAQVPSGTLKGRASAGGGSLEDLTPVQGLAILKGAGAYAKDNILGTVSQASGVPTGSAFEAGSNANGRYWRNADGFQACIKFVTVGSISIGAGGFQSYSLGTHAAAFAATPFEVPVYVGDNSLLANIGLESVSNTSAGNGVLRNNLNEARTFNGSIGVLAVGRWF